MNVVFTFDDGREDNYKAFLKLNELGLRATFFITTGFVDKTFHTDVFGNGRCALSIEQIKEMNQNGMEIALHGDRHITENNDYQVCYKKMHLWISKYNIKNGFSVPNSDIGKKEFEAFLNKNKETIAYVRVGRDERCYSFISKIHYVVSSLFGFQFSYNLFNKYNLIDNLNSRRYDIPSVVIKRKTRVKNVISFLKKYSKTSKTVVFMFHSIVDKPGNDWEWATKKFLSLCDYVSNDDDINVEALSKMFESEDAIKENE